MALTLRVLNGKDVPGAPAECLFEAARITIGNCPSDDLTLPDSGDVLCAEHVVLERDDAVYRVTGGRALEATHLNDRVVADRGPLPLSDGDVLAVGPHLLEAETEGQAADAADPLAEAVSGLWAALAAVAGAYERAAPGEGAEALRAAVGAGPAPLWSHEAVQAVARLLDEGPPGPPDDGGADDGPRTEAEVPAAVLEVLTDVLAEALRVARQFREEFVGHPFMHPPDAQFLYEGEGEAIRAHLLDPALTEPERERRLRYVEEAAEALALHQVAMLDGYKASVQAGLDELLGRLDPAAHRADVAETHEVFEALPALTEPVVLMRLRDECRALLREDWSVVEQRVFRPAFSKAYLEQMTAPHGVNSE